MNSLAIVQMSLKYVNNNSLNIIFANEHLINLLSNHRLEINVVNWNCKITNFLEEEIKTGNSINNHILKIGELICIILHLINENLRLASQCLFLLETVSSCDSKYPDANMIDISIKLTMI